MHSIFQFYSLLIVQDHRLYLFSVGQNMYNRVVLACTVNIYIPASLGRRPILRYQVLQVSTKILLTLLTVWGLLLTLVIRNIGNNLRLVLPDTFCRQYLLSHTLNIESKKLYLTYSLRLYFYVLYLGGFFMHFVSCQTNQRGQTSPKVPKAPVVSGTWELVVRPS